MTSTPTSRKERWSRSTTSGRVTTRTSLHPSSSGPPKSSAVSSRSCRLVPVAPSKMTTRSAQRAQVGRGSRGRAGRGGRPEGRPWAPPGYRRWPGSIRTPVRIYTRKGDDGTTGLLYGGRVSARARPGSSSTGRWTRPRPSSAWPGPRRSRAPSSTSSWSSLERDLYVLMAELATAPANRHKLQPGTSLVTEEMVAGLEGRIDGLDERVLDADRVRRAREEPPRRGARRGPHDRAPSRAGARGSPTPADADGIALVVAAYLNRLSDLVWTMARWQEGDVHHRRPRAGSTRPRRPAKRARRALKLTWLRSARCCDGLGRGRPSGRRAVALPVTAGVPTGRTRVPVAPDRPSAVDAAPAAARSRRGCASRASRPNRARRSSSRIAGRGPLGRAWSVLGARRRRSTPSRWRPGGGRLRPRRRRGRCGAARAGRSRRTPGGRRGGGRRGCGPGRLPLRRAYRSRPIGPGSMAAWSWA